MSKHKDKGITRMDGQGIPKMQATEAERVQRRKKIQEMDDKIKKEGLSRFLRQLKGDVGPGEKL